MDKYDEAMRLLERAQTLLLEARQKHEEEPVKKMDGMTFREKEREAARRYRAKNPQKHRDYMREYMRKRREEG